MTDEINWRKENYRDPWNKRFGIIDCSGANDSVVKVFPNPITITTVQFTVGSVILFLMWTLNLHKRPKISGFQGLYVKQVSIRSVLAAIYFYAYQVSYMILQRVSPVTHSVGNCVKRVVVIVTYVLFFHTTVSPINSIVKKDTAAEMAKKRE
ncbi:hypothetical protein L2E82_30446 [Cichorium intybus]|uniref:Uncharacterized protein n=1 Tax=Cichorium intybus TaxID=13427 RepID=A0ACB9D0E2_CICIN|nr:hypothetical protein L2E82_30446 [Cichorium intybus]